MKTIFIKLLGLSMLVTTEQQLKAMNSVDEEIGVAPFVISQMAPHFVAIAVTFEEEDLREAVSRLKRAEDLLHCFEDAMDLVELTFANIRTYEKCTRTLGITEAMTAQERLVREKLERQIAVKKEFEEAVKKLKRSIEAAEAERHKKGLSPLVYNNAKDPIIVIEHRSSTNTSNTEEKKCCCTIC